MKRSVITMGLLCLVLSGCTSNQEQEATAVSDSPHIAAAAPIQAGRYLVVVGGCNDCHTNGYLMMDGNIPEEDWLTGSPVGWQGPWAGSLGYNIPA